MDGAAYRDSWAWVHFLMNESAESRKVLIDYLQEIQRGDPPGPFSQFLRDRMPNAQSRMLHHFRRFQL